MNLRSIWTGFLLIALLGLSSSVAADELSLKDKVVKIEVTGGNLEDGKWLRETKKLLQKADEDGAAAVVIGIHVGEGNSKSGRVLMEAIAALDVKTVAVADSSAVSGGALVALAADEIWIRESGLIGGAVPVAPGIGSKKGQEAAAAQSIALIRAQVRALAKSKGHDPDIAEAFVDPSKEVKRGDQVISKAGEVLVLDGQEAVDLGIATRLVEGIEEASVVLAGEGEVVDSLPIAKKAEAEDEEGAAVVVPAADEEEEQNAFRTRETDYSGKIVVLEVGAEDLGNASRFEFMSRVIQRASDQDAAALIFDMDTPGGYAWHTLTIMMDDLQHAKCPTFSFVNSRALSAGALISIATDGIYMTPASSIGAATPVMGGGGSMGDAERAKSNSAYGSMARAVAKSKGYRSDVVEAMIDMEKEVILEGEVISAKGDILTLDAEQAIEIYEGKPLLAKGMVKTLEELIEAEGLKGEIVRASPSGFEAFAQWVTKLAPLLIGIGVAGAYAEMKAPGFGIPGAISLAAFSMFFFGHYIAGSLAGWEAVGVLVIGLIFIIVEIFLLPGTLVFGITGFMMVLGSLFYVMAGLNLVMPDPEVGGWLPVATSSDAFSKPFVNLALGIGGATLLMIALMRFLPESRAMNWLVLKEEVGGRPEVEVATTGTPSRVGVTGIVEVPLRPSGKAVIDGKLTEVVSTGGFVDVGQEVRITAEDGARTLVEAV